MEGCVVGFGKQDGYQCYGYSFVLECGMVVLGFIENQCGDVVVEVMKIGYGREFVCQCLCWVVVIVVGGFVGCGEMWCFFCCQDMLMNCKLYYLINS